MWGHTPTKTDQVTGDGDKEPWPDDELHAGPIKGVGSRPVRWDVIL